MYTKIVNTLSVLKSFQLSNVDLLFSYHAYSIRKVRKPKMTKLGKGVEVRAHYPTFIFSCLEKKTFFFDLEFEMVWFSEQQGHSAQGNQT